MQEFDNIKDMVYCEIDEISHQGKLDMNTINILGELVDILKDIGSVEMFEEGIDVQEDNYDYSRNGNSMSRGYSQRRMPIYYNQNNGNSYRGNRGSNGGYSRRSYGYSYDDSKSHMIEKLNNLMMEASNQQDKDAIQHLIGQIENN